MNLSKLLHPTGRGRNYTRLRGFGEAAMRVLYGSGWPARAWARVPGADSVQRIDHDLPLDPQHRSTHTPLRVAFASDLHLGPTTPARTLDRAFALLSEAAPDLLVLGGDYVFLEATPQIARELRDRVAAVPARTKVAVLGNHDLWTHHDRLEDALAEAGATVLINRAIKLPPPHDDIAILGLDDPWSGHPDITPALTDAEGAAFRIAVCHSPDGLPFVRDHSVSLLLSGHTHGGQIALPGPRPIIVPGPLGKRWPYGLHRVHGTMLFVSRGVGTTELPIRANAPADVAVFTLR